MRLFPEVLIVHMLSENANLQNDMSSQRIQLNFLDHYSSLSYVSIGEQITIQKSSTSISES